MQQVTTRRVIKPSSGVQPPAPLMRMPTAPSEALQPKKQTLWTAWLERFAQVEQYSSGLAQEAARIQTRPLVADMAEARRLQDNYLTPWSELIETFEAVAGGEVREALRNDYRSYLDLRTGLVRALIRRCLAPGETSVRQLTGAMLALQTFVDARRSGS